MKKVINGKKYDTNTAKAVCSYDNGCSYSDFNYVEETLYKKKTGEFFIYGEGGANSRYRETYGNCSGKGEAIVPIGDSEAMEFIEKYGDVDTYESLFGDVEE